MDTKNGKKAVYPHFRKQLLPSDKKGQIRKNFRFLVQKCKKHTCSFSYYLPETEISSE